MTGKKMLKGILTVTVLFGIVLLATNVEAKKYTQEELQKCIDKKKQEARAKGFPLTDPYAVKFACMKELEEE